jgi:hypothetical protein
MSEAEILLWLENTWLGAVAREVSWVWPLFEILHFMGLCILFGALLVVDLRVLGVGKQVPISSVMPFTRVALGGFALNLVSGIAFFCANPPNYWDNYAFRAKMALVLVGGVNALVFELMERRKLTAIQVGIDAGAGARLIAAGSLLTWTAVILLGRLLPFTGGIG